MEDSGRNGLNDFNLASRKAEEAALRRFEATQWLQSLVGPLGISSQPSEREFISCLRNGSTLCNAVNKIQPGAVPKVVENHTPLQSLTKECQTLPAYQHFENVRNLLDALEELKLPAFEASDLERDYLEAGSAAKVVDCILALKSYHNSKQMTGGNVSSARHTRSPLVLQSVGRTQQSTVVPSDSCRRLDMSTLCEKLSPVNGDTQKLEELMIRAIVDRMLESKENFDDNLVASFRSKDMDQGRLLRKIMSTCLNDQFQSKFPELKLIFKDFLEEGSASVAKSTCRPLEDLSATCNLKSSTSCLKKGDTKRRSIFQMQERELLKLKALLARVKHEFGDLQSQFHNGLEEIGNQVQEMSTAALGYQQLAKENKLLYNMIQDLKGNIRVYCRIRPMFGGESNGVVDFIGNDGSVVISDPSKPQKEGRKVFQFNQVFGPSATQSDVFKETRPLLRSVMDGYNVCIFAYGQTGSGKTHTMSGPSGGAIKDMGINYLALSDLFQMCNERNGIVDYEFRVQMIEIYNEQVRDLLAGDSISTKLEIRSCNDNGISLPDATMHPVKSSSDVLNLMKTGEANRVVSSTAVNNRSSRSHSVLTVHVHGRDTSGNIFNSCLHLVDLAGSERVDKSEVTGDRLKEAQHINKSLSCLGDVISALAQKSSHIPYRNSKLTLLLQDSLGGQAKTLMLAHVSPESDSFGEALSTLKFAQRVSTVELGAARLNKESKEVMELKEQIESLKKALENKEARSGKARSKEPTTPVERMRTTAEETTTPRSRRLSIENYSSVTPQKTTMNTEERKGIKSPFVPTRTRRASLEGPTYGKKNHLKSENVSKPLPFDIMATQKYSQIQDFEGSANHAAPRSPTSYSHKSRTVNTHKRSIPSLQLPKTPPEKLFSGRNEVQMSMRSSEVAFSMEAQAPNSSANGKRSQIRKSLRSIGKLINGSEKRNLQNLMEVQPFLNNASSIGDGKSPISALRRQSITGAQVLGDRSRRSSLGGKADTCSNQNRNSRTPPPIRPPSTKVTKQWL